VQIAPEAAPAGRARETAVIRWTLLGRFLQTRVGSSSANSCASPTFHLSSRAATTIGHMLTTLNPSTSPAEATPLASVLPYGRGFDQTRLFGPVLAPAGRPAP
jgi:hypothetical protein